MSGSPPHPRSWPMLGRSTGRVPRLSLRALGVLPDDGAAHAEPDAHGGDPIPDFRMLPESPRQVDHQSNAGARERVAECDRATVRIDPLIICGESKMITESEHLHGESFVDLNGTDVVDREPGLSQRLLRRRNRPDSHDL